jgi:hypothetical protein
LNGVLGPNPASIVPISVERGSGWPSPGWARLTPSVFAESSLRRASCLRPLSSNFVSPAPSLENAAVHSGVSMTVVWAGGSGSPPGAGAPAAGGVAAVAPGVAGAAAVGAVATGAEEVTPGFDFGAKK